MRLFPTAIYLDVLVLPQLHIKEYAYALNYHPGGSEMEWNAFICQPKYIEVKYDWKKIKSSLPEDPH